MFKTFLSCDKFAGLTQVLCACCTQSLQHIFMASCELLHWVIMVMMGKVCKAHVILKQQDMFVHGKHMRPLQTVEYSMHIRKSRKTLLSH